MPWRDQDLHLEKDIDILHLRPGVTHSFQVLIGPDVEYNYID